MATPLPFQAILPAPNHRQIQAVLADMFAPKLGSASIMQIQPVELTYTTVIPAITSAVRAKTTIQNRMIIVVQAAVVSIPPMTVSILIPPVTTRAELT